MYLFFSTTEYRWNKDYQNCSKVITKRLHHHVATPPCEIFVLINRRDREPSKASLHQQSTAQNSCQKYSSSDDVIITWFIDEKTFAVATPKDAQNVDTMRRDDRWDTLTCVQKLTASQLNLPHGTRSRKIRKLGALGQCIPPPRHVCRGCLSWAVT